MEGNGATQSGGLQIRTGETDDLSRTYWEISKHLLDAHTHSGQALEQYMLLQHLGEDASADELTTAIEQAIADHERIIAELEAALEGVSTATD